MEINLNPELRGSKSNIPNSLSKSSYRLDSSNTYDHRAAKENNESDAPRLITNPPRNTANEPSAVEQERPTRQANETQEKEPGFLKKLRNSRSKETVRPTPSGGAGETPTGGGGETPTDQPDTPSARPETSERDVGEGPPIVAESGKSGKATRFSSTAEVSQPPPPSDGGSTSETADKPSGGTSKLRKGRPEVNESDIGGPSGREAEVQPRNGEERPEPGQQDGRSTVDAHNGVSKYGKRGKGGLAPAETGPSLPVMEEIMLPDGTPAFIQPPPGRPTATPVAAPGSKKGKSTPATASTAPRSVQRPESVQEPVSQGLAEVPADVTRPGEVGRSSRLKKAPPPVQVIPVPGTTGDEAVTEVDPSQEELEETGGAGKSKKKGGAGVAVLTPEEQKLEDVRSLAR